MMFSLSHERKRTQANLQTPEIIVTDANVTLIEWARSLFHLLYFVLGEAFLHQTFSDLLF